MKHTILLLSLILPLQGCLPGTGYYKIKENAEYICQHTESEGDYEACVKRETKRMKHDAWSF